jgi:hypothetical protein
MARDDFPAPSEGSCSPTSSSPMTWRAHATSTPACSATRRSRAGPPSATGDKVITLKPRGRGTGGWWIRAVAIKRLRTLAAASFPTATYGCSVRPSARSTAPAPRRPGTTGQDPGGEGRVDAGLRVRGSRSLPGWRHAIGPRFVSFLANRETAKQPNQRGAGGGRDVPATTQAAPHLSAQAVSKRGRQAVKAAKEQTAKASRKLAAARPGGTTTVAPPIGAPPGPVTAKVTELPQGNDGGDGKPGPKPDTQTETATAEPPTNQ